MGISCGCFRKTDLVMSCSEPTSDRSHLVATSPRAIRALADYYSTDKLTIPSKLHPYFSKIIDGSFPEVRSFTVKLQKMTPKGIENIARLFPFYSDIRELHLWKVGLSVHSMNLLCPSLDALTDLHTLSLEDNAMDDQSVQLLSARLPRWEGLSELWLPANCITFLGAKTLADSLQSVHKLSVLNLDYNLVKDPGCYLLCKALISKGPLSTLSLQHNDIVSASGSGLESLGRLNPPLTVTALQGNFFDEADCARLRTEFGADKVRLVGQKTSNASLS